MMSGSIAVYDVTSGELVQILEGHADTVLSLTLNADNTLLVSTSTDRTAGYWQLPTVRGERGGGSKRGNISTFAYSSATTSFIKTEM